MAGKQIIPAVVKYTKTLADMVNSLREAGVDISVQKGMLESVSKRLSTMQTACANLKDVDRKARGIRNAKEQAFFYMNEVIPAMEALRTPADELEMIVDKEVWPIPTYGELMFEV